MKKFQYSFLTLFTLFVSGFALADAGLKIPANNPCSTDIQKYCKDVTPGQGRLASCMKDHAAELSSGCKAFGEKIKKEHPEVVKQIESGKKKSS
jgi:hypothetical protein